MAESNGKKATDGVKAAGKARKGTKRSTSARQVTSAPRTKQRKPAKPKKRARKPTPKATGTTTKPRAAKPPVDPTTIRLVSGKGGTGRGGGPGGHYWHIYASETRAGYVYINVIEEEPFGEHASIQIQVNKALHGRGIGKVAYRLACEQSGHDVIIAHMRKNNVPSQKAAAAAGFVVVDDPAITQLAMRWTRKASRRAKS